MTGAAELVAAIEQALKRCRQERQRLAAAEKRWQRLRQAMAGEMKVGRGFAALPELDALTTLDTFNVELIANLQEWAGRDAREHLANYTSLLRSALSDLEVHGSFPEYRVAYHIRVKLDDKRREARVGTRFHWSVLRGDISVEAVAAAVRKEVRRLFGSRMDLQTLIKNVFQAYRLAATEEGRREGEPVHILRVHKFVVTLRQPAEVFRGGKQELFQPYLPDEFAVDLGRLIEQGITQVDDRYRLRLHSVRDSRDSLFVVNFSTGEGHNYGLLSFQKVV